MNLQFSGSIDIRTSREKAFSFLVDPKSVGTCVPDLEELQVVGENQFNAKVKVGVAFVKGSLVVRGTITDRKPPSIAKLVAEGSGMGSSMKLETSFELSEEKAGVTSVKWTANAEIGGLITGVGSKLLQKTSENKVAEILDKIKARLEQ